MAGWLVGRLVSGLGAVTKDAVLPLATHAPCESLALVIQSTAGHALRRWLGTGKGAAAHLSTSAHTASAQQPPLPSADDSPSPSGDSSGDSGSEAPIQPQAPQSDPKPELVKKVLTGETESLAQRQLQRQAVVREFQRHPADTGSPQVMVAIWTHRVRELVRHFDVHRKQLIPMRHLEMLVHRRRRMLTWLRRTDFDAYAYTITKLGLKDVYTTMTSADRYREGLRPNDPVPDDSVNRLLFKFHTKYKEHKTSLWKRLRPQLVAEDPSLAAADVELAVEQRERRREQRAANERAQL